MCTTSLGGPFRIKFQSAQSGDPVYWKVSSELPGTVVGTTEKSAASNFYIRPAANCRSPLSKQFLISTQRGHVECYLRPECDNWLYGTTCTIAIREQCYEESSLKLVDRVHHSEVTVLTSNALFPKLNSRIDCSQDSFFIRPCFYYRWLRSKGLKFRKPCIAMVREGEEMPPKYIAQYRRKAETDDIYCPCSMLFQLEIAHLA